MIEIIPCIKVPKDYRYSVSVDSTADEGHVDQLTQQIFRYMEHDTPDRCREMCAVLAISRLKKCLKE